MAIAFIYLLFSFFLIHTLYICMYICMYIYSHIHLCINLWYICCFFLCFLYSPCERPASDATSRHAKTKTPKENNFNHRLSSYRAIFKRMWLKNKHHQTDAKLKVNVVLLLSCFLFIFLVVIDIGVVIDVIVAIGDNVFLIFPFCFSFYSLFEFLVNVNIREFTILFYFQ